jgi:biotin transporter BioY
VGRRKSGFLYLFTLGCCVIGWLLDAVRLPGLVAEFNTLHQTYDFHPSIDRHSTYRIETHAANAGLVHVHHPDDELPIAYVPTTYQSV